MIHAKIFSHGSKTSRAGAIAKELELLHIHPSDIINLQLDEEKERIGIGQVREFTRRMLMGPTQSPRVAGCISDADLLTIEAQNALLKILEEPPSKAIFFLGTQAPGLLLPTILSRCHMVTLRETEREFSDEQIHVRNTISSLLDASPSTIISAVAAIATDRIATKQWIIEAIVQLRLLLIAEVQGTKQAARIRKLSTGIRSLERSLGDISVNVTPKLALECALLRINDYPKI